MKKLVLFLLPLLFSVALPGQPAFQKISTVFTTADQFGLQTDIYFKDTTASYPVILLRTPYPRQQYRFIAQYFCQQDYIVVVQSVRGTGGSGGQMIPFLHETADGLQLLDQLTAKQWCNGSIGIFGMSYSSFCGLTLGTSRHPSLKALVNINGWVEPSLIARPSGVNHLMMNVPWMLFNFSGGKLVPGKYNADSLFQTVPVNSMLKGFGIHAPMETMQQGIDRLNKDLPYRNFDVPVLHVTGLYDFTKEGTFNLYDSLRKYNKTQQFIIGPWLHDQIFSGSKKIGDRDLPAAGYDSLSARILSASSAWFRKFLHNDPAAPAGTALLALPVFAEAFTLQAAAYPAQKIKPVQLYLHTDKESSRSLVPQKPARTTAVSFTSDPSSPVPTHGGANFHFFTDNIGLKQQQVIEQRKDVLTYTASPLLQPFFGFGKARVNIFVSYSGADCDFTAKLVAVDPDGAAWNIADGITRMSHTTRESTGKKDAQGQPIYAITIDLGHIAFQLARGWRLRLELAGSNFPKYERNPGNGSNPSSATQFFPVQQTIHHGGSFPSVLIVDELEERR